MEEQKPNEENVNQPASPQTPESPVKSKSDQVQETVDRNLADRAARQKTTDELIAKRKQTAALEAAAVVTSAEQMAKTGQSLAKGLHKAAEAVEAKAAEAAEAVQGEDEAKQATAEILAVVKTKADARELREIEMHNATMDALKEVTAQMQAACDYLNDIIALLTIISDKP
jgi:hypothetical protein